MTVNTNIGLCNINNIWVFQNDFRSFQGIYIHIISEFRLYHISISVRLIWVCLYFHNWFCHRVLAHVSDTLFDENVSRKQTGAVEHESQKMEKNKRNVFACKLCAWRPSDFVRCSLWEYYSLTSLLISIDWCLVCCVKRKDTNLWNIHILMFFC